MRVIEANQDNMKEGEYLEAMNALRDLHRNQEHDEEAITRPMRETIKKDMISLWKWVCTPPCDDDGDHFYTSAQSKMEEYLDEPTLYRLNEWREHYGIHKGKEFDFCEECGTCSTCYRAVHDNLCECDEEETDEEVEAEEEELDHLEEFPDHIRCCECECCISCRCCECKDDEGAPAVMRCDGCQRWYHYLDRRINFTHGPEIDANEEYVVHVLCRECIDDGVSIKGSQGAS